MKVKISPCVPATLGRVQRPLVRVEPPHVRGCLLTALAWASGAFTVLAVLASETARLLAPFLGGVGMLGAALCALLAALAFLVVLWVSRRLDASERNRAQVLLAGTALVGVGLVAAVAVVFAAGGRSLSGRGRGDGDDAAGVTLG